MDMTHIHKHWVETMHALMEKENCQKISIILHHSKRFLSLMSIGGTSSTYNSYVETIRQSIMEVLSFLVAKIHLESTHQGVYEILDSYKLLDAYDYAPVLNGYASPKVEPTAYLLRAVAKVVERYDLPQSLTILTLNRTIPLTNPSTCPVSELSIRIVFGIYAKATGEHRAKLALLLVGLFKRKHTDLYLAKIYPSIMANEPDTFTVPLVEKLAQIETFPVLSITKYISQSASSKLSPETIQSIRARIEQSTDQTLVDGLSTIAQIPQLFSYAQVVAIFNTSKTSASALFKKAAAFVEWLEGRAETSPSTHFVCSGSGLGELTCHHCTAIFSESSSQKPFFFLLSTTTDGTRIQLCRILYLIHPPEAIPLLIDLLRHKNIRVKWNSLRALSSYYLEEKDLSAVIALYQATAYDKIRLWALKVLERNTQPLSSPELTRTRLQFLSESAPLMDSLAPNPGPTTGPVSNTDPDSSPYTKEIEETAKRVYEGINFKFLKWPEQANEELIANPPEKKKTLKKSTK
ncbi:hypothetical protein NEDG_00416 [Nematocida displodere]|uniref:Clathrin/coatomer adaptor adaptin-like N-terminal domain-containing protein n=1 Tax=Nematocida displodere TaxID=1805483 RepID=A0A177EKF8_9MICR|nr:hypothetical protein NEDG_00416 [Nematocida displodere]